jgi:hypothetical protein
MQTLRSRCKVTRQDRIAATGRSMSRQPAAVDIGHLWRVPPEAFAAPASGTRDLRSNGGANLGPSRAGNLVEVEIRNDHRDRNPELMRLYSGMSSSMNEICAGYGNAELELLADFLRRTVDAGQSATDKLAAE